jgi:putative intracellular protease/amidase
MVLTEREPMPSGMNKRALLIVTSHAELGATGTKTGFWLEELAAPYYELADAGFDVTIASPLGGRPPADPKSESSDAAAVKRFLADPEATAQLASTRRLEDVRDPFDAYLVVGGHGVMWDLAESDVLARLLSRAWDDGRVVAAVCHGPAAFAKLGRIVTGRRVTGFSNEEEDAVGLTRVVPFALESKLKELGGRYERGPTWGSFAVRDGRLITGQNPASSRAVAKLVIEAAVSRPA